VDNGWCNNPGYGCGSQTWGLIGVGDTLYATGWGFVAKCPIADLDSMARDLYPAIMDSIAADSGS